MRTGFLGCTNIKRQKPSCTCVQSREKSQQAREEGPHGIRAPHPAAAGGNQGHAAPLPGRGGGLEGRSFSPAQAARGRLPRPPLAPRRGTPEGLGGGSQGARVAEGVGAPSRAQLSPNLRTRGDGGLGPDNQAHEMNARGESSGSQMCFHLRRFPEHRLRGSCPACPGGAEGLGPPGAPPPPRGCFLPPRGCGEHSRQDWPCRVISTFRPTVKTQSSNKSAEPHRMARPCRRSLGS